jgi:hypothetical protein
MPVSKGGSLQLWTADGKADGTIPYGPGLSRSCPTCHVAPYKRCITSLGRPNKKTHPARLTA